MSRETSKHTWMENLMRGLESEPNAKSEELTNELEFIGLQAEQTASKLKEKVAIFLQQRQNSRPQARSDSSFGRARQSFRWNHPSVRDFAQGGDPVQKMIEAARQWALEGLEQTDDQTPADPFVLAGIDTSLSSQKKVSRMLELYRLEPRSTKLSSIRIDQMCGLGFRLHMNWRIQYFPTAESRFATEAAGAILRNMSGNWRCFATLGQRSC